MQKQGWTLLFHACLIEQLQKLNAAANRAIESDPEGFESNANVKLFRALSQLILETIPSDPAREEYRQGNTMGANYRHWRRAKIGRRFRLFFRYDSKAKLGFQLKPGRILKTTGYEQRALCLFWAAEDRPFQPSTMKIDQET
ncbi:MAG: type II toxin-antitoxin system YhaV family toxin, partial [Methylococcales bacterium]|nr:type II toxin-antitoxin system YhaV family toxin [Methylococcales bacterium]